ncbi:MAG: phage tail tape measure protein [Vagococcus sp.]|jgi:TP901 family phage tail tape measure protein|nr:phage tail tape measure protein [Vagococcus sp.]
MGNDYNIVIGVEPSVNEQKVQRQIDKQTKNIKVNAEVNVGSPKYSKEIVQYYKDLEKQIDSFNKKNLSGYDLEIKKSQEQAKIFSNQIKAQMQERIDAENKVQAEIKKTAQATQNAFNLNIGRDQLSNNISSYLNNNAKLGSNLRIELIRIQNELKNADSVKLGELKKEFAKVRSEANALGQTGETVFSKLSKNASQFLNYLGSATIIMTAIRSIRNMISNVKELDASLVELRKVSDLTGQSLVNFVKRAYAMGAEVARTGKEVIDATTVFKRAGYSLEESFDLAKASLVMINVGDGIKNVEEASSALIATLKGFKMSDSDAMKIVDMINETSNNAAIDFNNITEGLRRVSGTLSQTGTSIQETIGLITGGFGSLRDIESVSSGILMISQRLRGVNEDGEEIEGLAPKLKKSFKEIANIDIEDANGNLRGTYAILADMAEVFPKLTSKQRQYLGELAAGNRQIKVLNAIVDGWADVEQAVTSANNSEGSALSENEKVLDSVQGRVNALKSSFQQLSINTINSGWVKGFFDLLNVITQLIDKLGLFNIALVVTSGILGSKTILGVNGLAQALQGLAVKMGFASTAAGTLMTSLSLMIPVALVIGGVTAIVKAYDYFNVTLEEQIEITKKLQTEYDDLHNKSNNVKSELDNVNKRIDELNKKENKTFIENDELEKLKSATIELESQNRLLAEQATMKKQEASDSVKEEYDKDFSQQFKSLTLFEKKKLSTRTYIVTQLVSEEDHVKELISEYERLSKVSSPTEEDLKNIGNYRKELVEYGVKFNDYINRYDIDDQTSQSWKSFRSLIDSTLNPAEYKTDLFNSIYNSSDFSKAKKELEDLAKAGELNPGVIETNERYKLLLDETGLSAKDATDQIKALVSEQAKGIGVNSASALTFTDDQIKSIDTYQSKIITLKKAYEDVSKVDITDLIKKFPKYNWTKEAIDGTKDLKDVINELIDHALKEAIESVPELSAEFVKMHDDLYNVADNTDELIAELDSLEVVLAKVKKGQSLSASEAASLINKYSELSGAVKVTANGYQIEEDALVSLINKKTGEANISISAQIEATEKTIESIRTRIEAYKAETEALDILVSKYKNGGNGIADFIQQYGVEDAKRKFGIARVESWLAMSQDDTLSSSALDEQIKKLDELKGKIVIPHKTDKGSKSEFSQQIDFIAEKIKVTENNIKNLNAKLENTTGLKAQIKLYGELITEQTKLTKEYNNAANAYETQYKNALKNKNLTPDDILNIKNGSYKIEQFSGKGKDSNDEKRYNAIQEGIKLRDQSANANTDSLSAIAQLTKYSTDLANIPWDNASKKIDGINESISLLNEQLNNSKNYKEKNDILDKILKKQGAIVTEYTKTITDAETSRDELFKTIDKKYTKNVKLGKKISTDGITNEDQLAIIIQYNAQVDNLSKGTATLNIEQEKYNNLVSETNTKKFENINAEIDKLISKRTKLLSEIDVAAGFMDANSVEQIALFQAGFQEAAEKVGLVKAEIRNLRKEYTNGKISVDEFYSRLEKLDSEQLSAAQAMQNYQKQIVSAIKARYDEELKLSDKALKEALKNIEKAKKAQIDALNEQIKKFKEIIDARKKLIKEQEDTDNYNEQVDEYNKAISKLQTRIERLKKAELDGDREAGKERRDLEKELEDQKKALAKLQKDRQVDLALDALDEEYDAYEKMKKEQISDAEAMYDKQISEAQRLFDLKKEQIESLYENEKQLIIEAAELTTKEFSKAFTAINQTLSQYGLSMSTDLSGALNANNSILTNTPSSSGSSATANKSAIKTLLKSGTSKTGDSALNNYIKGKYGSYLTFGEMVELARMLGLTGINSESDVKGNSENREKIRKKLISSGFEKGGIAEVSSNSLISKLTGGKEDGVALVRNGEGFVRPEHVSSIEKLLGIVPNMNNLIRNLIPNTSNLITNNNSSPVINFNLTGGTITQEAMPQFNKWKTDIINEFSKIIIGGSKKR